MIPPSEITAVLAVIERLEETPALTAVEIFRKERARRLDFLSDGSDLDVLAHQAKYSAKAKYQPRNKNHPVYGDTHFALGFQARCLDAHLEDWFAWAHMIPPSPSNRIKAILKRTKMLDLRDRFISVYDKHVENYWKTPPRHAPTGDRMFDHLQGIVPFLNVSLLDIEDRGGGDISYSFKFHCLDCGGYEISTPDDDDDNGPAICSACGLVFGSFGEVKDLARHIGQEKLKQLGML